MTAIKMCGITRREDAEMAVALGVHALGFVLWPGSPRHAPLADVGRIVCALPPFVTPVGVFVNPTAAAIEEAVQVAGIRVAQIHGEVPEWPAGTAPIPLLRAVHLGAGDRGAIEPAVPPPTPVLLDVHDPVRHGGTGCAVDWARARQVARMRIVVLAGGLTPDNVGHAIETARPYAVDVASGIEAQPGVKDHALMRQFVDAVRKKEPASFYGVRKWRSE